MYWGWAYDGVNASIPRNTGPECSEYLSPQRRWIESILMAAISILAFKWSITRMKPMTARSVVNEPYPGGKQILLIAMTFTLGLELGFKFASRTVIYVLNPCHITTIIQIYLLASKPSNVATVLFRLQMNYLNGPLLAFLFPETDSRLIPMEAAIYWVQHGLMFIIPLYLLRLGGAYNMEALSDLSWNVISYAFNIIYHFVILQMIAVPAQVNLNHMLCPALLDPFDGPNYRLIACFHQAILCPLICKTFCWAFSPNNYESDFVSQLNSTPYSQLITPETIGNCVDKKIVVLNDDIDRIVPMTVTTSDLLKNGHSDLNDIIKLNGIECQIKKVD